MNWISLSKMYINMHFRPALIDWPKAEFLEGFLAELPPSNRAKIFNTSVFSATEENIIPNHPSFDIVTNSRQYMDISWPTTHLPQPGPNEFSESHRNGEYKGQPQEEK